MKTIIKEITLTICCSFTVIIVANAFLAGEAFAMTISVLALRQTFWICVVASLSVKFITSINYPKDWMNDICGLLAVFASVFGLGTFVFQLIPLNGSVYISVSIMIIIIYAICVSLIYAIQKDTANAINEKLNSRTKIMKEEHHGKDN